MIRKLIHHRLILLYYKVSRNIDRVVFYINLPIQSFLRRSCTNTVRLSMVPDNYLSDIRFFSLGSNLCTLYFAV